MAPNAVFGAAEREPGTGGAGYLSKLNPVLAEAVECSLGHRLASDGARHHPGAPIQWPVASDLSLKSGGPAAIRRRAGWHPSLTSHLCPISVAIEAASSPHRRLLSSRHACPPRAARAEPPLWWSPPRLAHHLSARLVSREFAIGARRRILSSRMGSLPVHYEPSARLD